MPATTKTLEALSIEALRTSQEAEDAVSNAVLVLSGAIYAQAASTCQRLDRIIELLEGATEDDEG